MDKTDIRIPTDEELTAYMEESAVSANGAYEQSPVVLMVDDAAIGTLGKVRKLLTLQPLQHRH